MKVVTFMCKECNNSFTGYSKVESIMNFVPNCKHHHKIDKEKLND